MNSFASKMCACLLTGMLASPLWGATPLGGLSITGAVWTNRVVLPSGSSVFPGDTVETDESGLGVIVSPAIGRFEVRPGAKVTFQDDSALLAQGVVASDRLPVTMRDFTIAPRDGADSGSWFVVSDRNNELLVAAYRGDVVIRRAGATPFVVPAGSYALAAAPAPPRDNKDSDENDSRSSRRRRRRGGAAGGSGGAASAGSNAGWTLGGLSHAASIAVVTGVTAAAISGVVALNVLDEDVSPQ